MRDTNVQVGNKNSTHPFPGPMDVKHGKYATSTLEAQRGREILRKSMVKLRQKKMEAEPLELGFNTFAVFVTHLPFPRAKLNISTEVEQSRLGRLTSGCTDGRKQGCHLPFCRHPSVSHVTRITKKTMYLAASGLSHSTSDLYCIMHTDCVARPWLLYVMQLDLQALTRDQTYIPCIVIAGFFTSAPPGKSQQEPVFILPNFI